MRIKECQLTVDNIETTIVGPLSEEEYRRVAKADYNNVEVTIVESTEFEKYVRCYRSALDTFTDEELFLLSQAIEEIQYRINEAQTPIYRKYVNLINKINSIRNAGKAVEDE